MSVENQDRRMLKKGYRFRVTYWNHTTGGDDTESDVYMTEDPRVSQNKVIRRLFAQIKVASLAGPDGRGDYEIVELKET